MTADDETPVLKVAETAADYDAFGDLCRAYVGWCRDQYRDMPWFFEAVFGHQSLDDELKALAVKYRPPAGRVILGVLNGRVVAGGAYRTWSDGVCELKRLYVSDAARGLGLGRKLSEALAEAARRNGFHTMLLDTADRLTAAIAMYETMGFERVAPYQDYPKRLAPHLIFMRRALQPNPLRRR